jgi:hypothetical protein
MGFVRVDDDYTYKGYRLVIIENEFLKIVILPEKGADIYQFIDKRNGIDFLWKTPMGLRSGVKPVPAGYGNESQFSNSYEGGWQTVFPSGGSSCSYKGINLEMCGDAAMACWNYRIVDPGPDMVQVAFETETQRLPFKLQKTIRVAKDDPSMKLQEIIVNKSDESLDYVWGQHVGFEGTLIRKGGWRLNIPCNKVYTNTSPKLALSQTSTAGIRKNRLPQDGEYAWPLAAGNDGAPIDLSRFPDDNTNSCDIAYLHDLSHGSLELFNRERDCGFELSWDKEQFPYIWYYQNFKGSYGYPWYGMGNGMVLEPITSFPAFGLCEAMARNNHRVIQGRETISARFTARVLHAKGGS